MERKMNWFIIVFLIVITFSNRSFAEDINAFSPSVKSNAMLVVDTSESMSWPVYNHHIDYAAFFTWAVSQNYAIDEKGMSVSYNTIPWEKNKIYLVSSYLGYSEIDGPQGEPYAVCGDPLYSGRPRRQLWINGGVFDTGWVITDWNTMANTITTNPAGYVVYPDINGTLSCVNHPNLSDILFCPSSDIPGHTLYNNQHILLTDFRTDPKSNIVKDYGMLGYLKSSGVYFCGLFETGAPFYTITKHPDAAVKDQGRHRVYAFATGNFLSFIKLIEDMKGLGDCSGGSAGWENICYQPVLDIGTKGSGTGEDDAVGNFTCCNGEDGVGQRIFSRLDVVCRAMNQVVEDTSNKINWGVFQWSGENIGGKARFGSSVATIRSAMSSLAPKGGTPMGKGMQMAYDYGYDYLAAHPDSAACSRNYLLVLTDGFPSGDTAWKSITKDDDHPDFSLPRYHDMDAWGGDPIQGYGNVPNYSDDVARWMYRNAQADYHYTTHTIGFGMDNPLLQDIADEGNGLYLTAYDQEQLINAFYSLGLSMTDAVSFTAPALSVDQTNRAQSGNELYTAFFKPVTDGYWQGNLKRYYLKWYANGTEEVWDAVNATATTSAGLFKDTARSYWSKVQDGSSVDKGGAGGLLKDNAEAYFRQKNYYQRVLKTWKGGQMVDMTTANLNATDCGLVNATDFPKVINFMHGYTFDADANGKPVGVRPWLMGDIIHSEPIILDYVDATNDRNLTHRYVLVGANDGMLHVFDSKTGQERLAFVPPDLLTNLWDFQDVSQHRYGVDGYICAYQTGRNPELVIVGERRGGSHFWALNCTNTNPAQWHVAWHIQPGGAFAELGQSWSEMVFVQGIHIGNRAQGLGVFCGGYDPKEDSYQGKLPEADTKGRGIFVINVQDGTPLFRVSYGAANATTTSGRFTSIARTDMNFCFPGSPTVVTDPEASGGDPYLVIYAIDIAAQVWKIACNGTWSVAKLFAANGPGMCGGASAASGLVDKLDGLRDYNVNDTSRKCFASPEVSYAGDCSTDHPVIYFGTGDKALPKSQAVSNRFYAVFDMSHNASMLPLDETDLLNITCDEFDINSTLTAKDTILLKGILGDNYATQAQGWYIVLNKQDDCITYYGNMSHEGEKVTNAARLFNKKIYFNSYIPTINDPCHPKGKALFYSLGYCYGDAAFEIEPYNTGKSINDRYFTVNESTPPSPVKIIAGPGGVILKASAGSKIINKYLEADSGTHLYWWKYADDNQ